MNEGHFQRFDPQTMDHRKYICDSTVKDMNIRPVSVLTGIFNPLVAEFASRIGKIDEGLITTAQLVGSAPSIKRYSSSTNDPHLQFKAEGLKRFSNYCFSINSLGSIHSDMSLFVPIGHYGPELAYSIVQAGRTMYGLIQDTMADSAIKTNTRYGEFLERETFQGDSLHSLMEGVQTTAATFALISAEKWEEETEGVLAFYREAIDSGIVTELSKIAPNGQIFPMAVEGYYFSEPFMRENGRLKMKTPLKRSLSKDHALQRAAALPGRRGEGCPAGDKTIPIYHASTGESTKESGVNLMASLYIDCLEYYLNSTGLDHQIPTNS